MHTHIIDRMIEHWVMLRLEIVKWHQTFSLTWLLASDFSHLFWQKAFHFILEIKSIQHWDFRNIAIATRSYTFPPEPSPFIQVMSLYWQKNSWFLPFFINAKVGTFSSMKGLDLVWSKNFGEPICGLFKSSKEDGAYYIIG